MRVLLIDDDAVDRKAVVRLGTRHGLVVSTAAGVAEGLDALSREPFDAVLVDFRLGGDTAFDFLERADRSVPIVILTGDRDDAAAAEAIQRGAQDYLRKDGLTGELLVRTLRFAQERRAATERLETLAAQLRGANDRLEAAANHDPLTGLMNRRGLRAALIREADHSRRRGDRMAALFLDCDDFKAINDDYGHTVGDEVLVAVADALRAATRATDAVARVGGDEFVVLLSDPRRGVTRVAERVRAGIADIRLPTPSGPVTVTASIGCSDVDPWTTEDVGTLLKAAGTALRKSKDGGKDAVSSSASWMMAREAGSALGILEVHTSLAAGVPLRAEAVPVVATADRRVVGYQLRSLRFAQPGDPEVPPLGLPIAVGLRPETLRDEGPGAVADAVGALALRAGAPVGLEVDGRNLGDVEALRAGLAAMPTAPIDLTLAGGRMSRADLEQILLLGPQAVTVSVDLGSDPEADPAVARTLERMATMLRFLPLRGIAVDVHTEALRRVVEAAGFEYAMGDAVGPPVTFRVA